MRISRKVFSVMLVALLVLCFAQASMATELSFGTRSLNEGTVGVDYSERLVASGGNNILWAVVGSLPPGLNLSSNGVISGRPTAQGSYSFLISAATDSYLVAVKYTMKINPAAIPLAITTQYLNSGKVGVPYADSVAANVTGVTWTHSWGTSGNGGLTFNNDNGTITGTNLTAGTYTLTVTANATGAASPVSKSFTIEIHREDIVPIDIITDNIPSGIIGTPYSTQLLSNKDEATWELAYDTTLPGNLSLSANGTISSSGILTATAGTCDFIVSATATDAYGRETTATKEFTLEIIGDNFAIITTALPDGTVNNDYNYVITANQRENVKWEVNDTNLLPEGIVLDSESGALYGTPVKAGEYGFEIKATWGTQTDTGLFILKVNDASTPTGALTIDVDSLPDGTQGMSYRGGQGFQLTHNQGTTHSEGVWRLVNGSLGGLRVTESGLITGECGTADTYTAEIMVTYNGQTASKYFTLTIHSSGFKFAIDSSTTGAFTVPINTTYRHQFKANASNVKWSIVEGDGALPDGLRFSKTSGLLAGVPTVADTFAFTVRADVSNPDVDFDEEEVIITVTSSEYGSGEDDSGDCSMGLSFYALSVLGGFVLLRRKH